MTERAEIFAAVYQLVSQIPPGKVITYGDIAGILNINPRYVGYILHHNPSPGEIPCHRIVNSKGRVADTFAFGGGEAQQKLLEAEGIGFTDGRIELAKYRYQI